MNSHTCEAIPLAFASGHEHAARIRPLERLARFATLAAILVAMPCSAHHSFANFEMTKTVTLQGTVKELQWTNPHCFLQLLVPGAAGSVEWSLEMNSTLATTARAGGRTP